MTPNEVLDKVLWILFHHYSKPNPDTLQPPDIYQIVKECKYDSYISSKTLHDILKKLANDGYVEKVKTYPDEHVMYRATGFVITFEGNVFISNGGFGQWMVKSTGHFLFSVQMAVFLVIFALGIIAGMILYILISDTLKQR